MLNMQFNILTSITYETIALFLMIIKNMQTSRSP